MDEIRCENCVWMENMDGYYACLSNYPDEANIVDPEYRCAKFLREDGKEAGDILFEASRARPCD